MWGQVRERTHSHGSKDNGKVGDMAVHHSLSLLVQLYQTSLTADLCCNLGEGRKEGVEDEKEEDRRKRHWGREERRGEERRGERGNERLASSHHCGASLLLRRWGSSGHGQYCSWRQWQRFQSESSPLGRSETMG